MKINKDILYYMCQFLSPVEAFEFQKCSKKIYYVLWSFREDYYNFYFSISKLG